MIPQNYNNVARQDQNELVVQNPYVSAVINPSASLFFEFSPGTPPQIPLLSPISSTGHQFTYDIGYVNSHQKKENVPYFSFDLQIPQESIQRFPGTKYGDVLWNLDNSFHMITGYDPFRLLSILQYGILPANQHTFPLNFRRCDTYTPGSGISVWVSPAFISRKGEELFSFIQSFPCIVMNKRADYRNTAQSGIEFEGIIDGGVPVELIDGIMLDENMLDVPFEDLSLCLGRMARYTVADRILSIMATLASVGHRVPERISNEIMELNQQGGFLSMTNADLLHFESRIMGEISLFFGHRHNQRIFTLRNFLSTYIDNNITIYNESGHTIQTLRR